MAVFVLFSVSIAHADSRLPVGHIVAVEGTAYVGGRVKIRAGDPVFMHNALSTAPNGRLVLLLIDDTEITLGGDSELIINEFVFDPYDPAENRALFGFARGVFQFVSGMVAKKDKPDVRLRTPLGTIGIRGTRLWGGSLDGRYGVYVYDGAVIYNLPEASITVAAGTGVFIKDADSVPDGPGPWTQETLQTAAAMIALRGDDDLKSRIEQEMSRNIGRRHEYRKIMWPHKTLPETHAPKSRNGNFPYSEEFLEHLDKNR
jgi:hypothetical protein